jgi:hypothetical protein
MSDRDLLIPVSDLEFMDENGNKLELTDEAKEALLGCKVATLDLSNVHCFYGSGS